MNFSVFEKAFLTGSCPIYGSPPVTLMHVIVALNLPRLSDQRFTREQLETWSRWHVERSRTLLNNFYLETDAPSITDLEALQSIILIFFCNVGLGTGHRALPLLQRGAEVVRRACLSGPLPASEGSYPPPTTAVEWLIDDMRMRAFLSFWLVDIPYSYFGNRTPYMDYTAQPFRLACAEYYFDGAIQEISFHLLKSEQGPEDMSILVDMERLFWDPDPVWRKNEMRRLVAPIFTRGRTLCAVNFLTCVLRFNRIKMRQFAKDHGVDTFALACKLSPLYHSEELTAAEAQYLDMSLRFEELLHFFRDALPREIELQLSDSGDPSLLFSTGSILLFGDVRRVHTFILLYTVMLSTVLENWVDEELLGRTASFRASAELTAESPPHSASVDSRDSSTLAEPEQARHLLQFFSSPVFQRSLEVAIMGTSLLRAQLQADPELRYASYATVLSSSRIGAFHLAAWKVHAAAGPFLDLTDPTEIARAQAMNALEADVRTTIEWITAIGKIYPFAMQSANILTKFTIAAGMSEADGTSGKVAKEEIEATLLKREMATITAGMQNTNIGS